MASLAGPAFFATAFFAVAFFAVAFFATAFFATLLAGPFAALSVGTAFFEAVAAFLADIVTFFAGDEFAAFVVFSDPSGLCSPTAESRRTTTRPAPLACALTGDLDTRPA
ncbi:hypothetical protein [Streptomyces sporangiiformans]|uniref:hypothetical protein n=1 Tax=Streptomyces sporangiiformans TaxID=2315329 RepID=UPI001F099BB7|nr:hypothetical protein [Streptomyces sporangiiformans]